MDVDSVAGGGTGSAHRRRERRLRQFLRHERPSVATAVCTVCCRGPRERGSVPLASIC